MRQHIFSGNILNILPITHVGLYGICKNCILLIPCGVLRMGPICEGHMHISVIINKQDNYLILNENILDILPITHVYAIRILRPQIVFS